MAFAGIYPREDADNLTISNQNTRYNIDDTNKIITKNNEILFSINEPQLNNIVATKIHDNALYGGVVSTDDNSLIFSGDHVSLGSLSL
jgi:hypothetical protein